MIEAIETSIKGGMTNKIKIFAKTPMIENCFDKKVIYTLNPRNIPIELEIYSGIFLNLGNSKSIKVAIHER
jgi:hypothetical protein